MFEDLRKMLNMQRLLDERIFKEKGITEYPLENMNIALFVELGELMNELPTKFKHWKSTAVDNREKALIEYVDCIHFALSLTNHWIDTTGTDIEKDKKNLLYNADNRLADMKLSVLLNMCMVTEGVKLKYLFAIGRKVGFKWDEIYNAYLGKNAVNYERLNNGY